MSCPDEYRYNLQSRQAQVDINEAGTIDDVVLKYRYNANGIRISQTKGPETTLFHVDENNPTGYAQVREEGVDNVLVDGKLSVGEVDRIYVFGSDVLQQFDPSVAAANYYLLYDAHGSTRLLLDPSGNVVDSGANLQLFDYEAYGRNISVAAPNPLTSLLYSGEFTDSSGQQYLRARYYEPATGRFNRLDPFSGVSHSPRHFHKYLYTIGDPANRIDPSGLFSLGEQLNVTGINQSNSRTSNSQQVSSGTKASSRLLVSITLLEMQSMAFGIPQIQSSLAYMAVYYAYLYRLFDQTYSKPKNAPSLIGQMDDLASYLVTLPNGLARLKENFNAIGPRQGNVKLLKNSFLDTSNAHIVSVLWMPYMGSRKNDNILASVVARGSSVLDIIKALQGDLNSLQGFVDTASNTLVSLGVRADGRVNGFRWHHNEIVGVMQSVDADHHSKPHTGGARFYEIIANLRKGSY